MKKQDIPIIAVLFLLLFAWPYLCSRIFPPQPPKAPETVGAVEEEPEEEAHTASAASAPEETGSAGISAPVGAGGEAVPDALPAALPSHASAEPELRSLSNATATVTVSSWGGGIVSAILHDYKTTLDQDSDRLHFDFSSRPALSYEGIPGLSSNHDFSVAASNGAIVVTRRANDGLSFERTISFRDAYLLKVSDRIVNTGENAMSLPKHSLWLGPMRNNRGETASSGYVYLGIDSQATLGGEKTRHWGSGSGLRGEHSLSQSFLKKEQRGGCMFFKPPLQEWLPPEIEIPWAGKTDWVAAKNKFFAQILAPEGDIPASSLTMRARRQITPASLKFSSGIRRKQFPLDKAAVTVGRDRENDIVLNATSIAGRHCVISREGAAYVARATEQTARISVNGVETIEGKLTPGDVLTIGTADLVFLGGEDPGLSQTWTRNPVLDEVSAGLDFGEQTLRPGQALSREFVYYIGPKKYSLLKALARDSIMEFGFWGPVCKVLLVILNGIHAIIPNYGLAIILLTFMIRVMFWPVMNKSTQTMRKMQHLQPQLQALKAQYGNDQQKFLQKQQELFKEHKVNPLGGCLPMLIQIPVLIGFFTVLRSAVELRFSGFLWIKDLSEPEGLFSGLIPFWPYQLNILPLLMTATTIWQQRLTPTSGDARQQQMMAIMMPVMFLFLFYNMASALVLYWTVSQCIAIVEMVIRNRMEERKKAAAAPRAR